MFKRRGDNSMVRDIMYEESFCCLNPSCNSNSNLVYQIYVWKSNLEKGEFPVCPNCGQPYSFFIPEDKSSHGISIQFNRFSSLSSN